MIFNYGFSMRGKSHAAQNKPCQDAHCIRQLENGWYVAAAADGVGSKSNAEEGAQLAVKTAVNFVYEYMPCDCSIAGIKSMLRTAFNYAVKVTLRLARERGLPADCFDTTLSLAIYDGSRIVYAHSGDGAILGYTTFGELVEITKRQKGDDGVSMIPLRHGYTTWEIDVYEEDLAGVLLVTDGVLDALSPYLLKLEGAGSYAENTPVKLYLPIGAWLADPAAVPEDEEGQSRLREDIGAFLTADPDYDSEPFYQRLKEVYRARVGDGAEEMIAELRLHNYPVSLMQGVQDDKTAVGLINTQALVEAQPEAAYRDADWAALQEKWDQIAYPSMYAVTDTEAAEAEPDLGAEKLKVSVQKWMKVWTRLENHLEKYVKAEKEEKDEAQIYENSGADESGPEPATEDTGMVQQS